LADVHLYARLPVRNAGPTNAHHNLFRNVVHRHQEPPEHPDARLVVHISLVVLLADEPDPWDLVLEAIGQVIEALAAELQL
jgi:hypothetical protein